MRKRKCLHVLSCCHRCMRKPKCHHASKSMAAIVTRMSTRSIHRSHEIVDRLPDLRCFSFERPSCSGRHPSCTPCCRLCPTEIGNHRSRRCNNPKPRRGSTTWRTRSNPTWLKATWRSRSSRCNECVWCDDGVCLRCCDQQRGRSCC